MTCISKSDAQKFYSAFDAGYNFGLAPQNITSNVNIGPSQTSNAVVKGSFGQGINCGITGGYLYSPNFSFELGISFSQSPSFEGSYIKDTSFKHQVSIKANMLRLAPGIKLTKGDGKTQFYLKLGLVFRLAGQAKLTNTFYDPQTNTTTVSEWKYFKGFSMGAYSAFGYSYKPNNKISFYAELMAIAQSWAPKFGDVVKYTINGTSSLETVNPSQQHTHFSDHYTVTNSTYTTWEPTEQLKQYYSFSSIGLKIGVVYFFNKKNESTK